MKGTLDFGLAYGKESALQVYCDSSWASDLNDRRSVSGMVTMLNHGVVSYFSRKQKCAALSSSEAEYIAASEATKETIRLRRLLRQLPGYHLPDGPTIIQEDNQGCLAMANATSLSKRTKHIDVRYHYVNDMVREGEVILEYSATEVMLADMMTKPIPQDKHQKHRSHLNVIDCCSGGELQ